MNSMMQLENELKLGTSNEILAEITACKIMGGMPTLFGHEFTFDFRFAPMKFDKENALTLTRLNIVINLIENNRSLKIGRLTSRTELPRLFNRRNIDIQLQLGLRSDELIVLADRTHQGDVTFEFDVTARFGEDTDVSNSGWLIVPHSTWLQILNRVQFERYELIVIRTPVRASHLHKPFSSALSKIREAEREFTRGNWNGTASACRSAWNTVLSSVTSTIKKDQKLEHLLTNVTGDPRRQKFALAVTKGFHNVVNEAVHLEGNVQSNRTASDLTREDALLCLHWYSAAIGYLASIANVPTGTPT